MDIKELIQNRKEVISKLRYKKDILILAKNCDLILAKEKKIFWLDDENIEFIQDVFDYFYGNKEFEKKENRLLSKGLLIIGNVGSGKSLIMEQISKNLTGLNAFKFNECTRISNEWLNKDCTFIFSVLAAKINNGRFNHLCCDDIGDEEPVPNYGTIIEPIEKVITIRNRIWHKQGIKTHWTTNLPLETIEERYGERARSRLEHMSNIMYLGADNESTDRRINWK